jgi:hypothetical protein
MRYRLRTLLVVLAIAGLLFARVGYLKRRAEFHRQAGEDFVRGIAAAEWASEREIEECIGRLAAGHSGLETRRLRVEGGGRQGVTVVESRIGYGIVIRNNQMADDWHKAIYHRVMAEKYEQACFYPWQMLVEPKSL